LLQCARIETKSSQKAYKRQEQPGDRDVTNRSLKCGAIIVALALTLAGCMPAGPSNEFQAQYLMDRRVCPPGAHAETSAVSANGYWCVLN
jgi:hypothetical protein